jgi:hypothetical protein
MPRIMLSRGCVRSHLNSSGPKVDISSKNALSASILSKRSPPYTGSEVYGLIASFRFAQRHGGGQGPMKSKITTKQGAKCFFEQRIAKQRPSRNMLDTDQLSTNRSPERPSILENSG